LPPKQAMESNLVPNNLQAENQHSVHFYRDDHGLCDIVARFIGEGLKLDQPGIVIATTAHRNAIARGLDIDGFDVERLRHTGDLLLLDARETLSGFLIGGKIDDACFRANVGRVIMQAHRGREQTVVRAYGEMVDVLWKDGKPQSAIRLEVLWNDLAKKHRFSLLCGYAMGNFFRETTGAGFDDVCAQHNHVVSPALADA